MMASVGENMEKNMSWEQNIQGLPITFKAYIKLSVLVLMTCAMHVMHQIINIKKIKA